MNIAYITYYPKERLKSHHGRLYYIGKSLENLGHNIIYIDNLSNSYQNLFRLKSFYYRFIRKRNYIRIMDKSVAKNISKLVSNSLQKKNIDLIVAPGTIEVAYLKTEIPVIIWTDTTFAGLEEFYDKYKNLSKSNIRDAYHLELNAHKIAKYIVYPSDWAAQSAIKNYKIEPDKIKVINFGSTINKTIDERDLDLIIKKRKKSKLKLFFAAIEWERKGGDILIEAFKKILNKFPDAELHIAGIKPEINNKSIINNIYLHGFLKKDNTEEYKKLQNLFKESHFFVVPSRAETYGMVFAEAGSYALPVLTSDRGGIPAVIKNGKNGYTFSYVDIANKIYQKITELYLDNEQYYQLAKNSFNEFKTRLNWDRAGQEFNKLINSIKK